MKFFKSIGAFLKRLWHGSYDLLQDNSYLAVLVTQKLKKLLHSPVMDVLTAVLSLAGIPHVDKLMKLRSIIPVVASKVASAHGVLQEHDQPSNALDVLFFHIEALPEAEHKKFWIEFAAQLNMDLSDDELSKEESIARTQQLFERYFKGK